MAKGTKCEKPMWYNMTARYKDADGVFRITTIRTWAWPSNFHPFHAAKFKGLLLMRILGFSSAEFISMERSNEFKGDVVPLHDNYINNLRSLTKDYP